MIDADLASEFRFLARKIGVREYVVSRSGEIDYVMVSDIGIPRMNGGALSVDEVYSVDEVTYRGKEHKTQMHNEGVVVYMPDGVLILPFCSMDDVHDFIHLTHCLNSGSYPTSDTMINLLNKEEVERILGSNRLSRSPSA